MAKGKGKIYLSIFLPVAFVSLLLTFHCAKQDKVEIPPPPETKVEEVVDVLHGVEIVDPYRWLENRESEDTARWIEVQNAYTDSILNKLSGREDLRGLLEKLIKIDTISVPMEYGGRYFFYKRKGDQDLSVIYMREGIDGEDEVLIDPHPWSEDKTISALIQDVSGDGRMMAYGVRRGGEDEIEIKFMDVDRKADLPDSLPRGRYFGVSITSDKAGFYFTRHTLEGPRIYYRPLGNPDAADTEVFGSGYGPEMILFGDLSEDGRWLVIHVLYGPAATEIYLKDIIEDSPVFPVVRDISAWSMGEIVGDVLYIQTNWEAPNSRIITVDPTAPARENWREIIPEGDSVLQGFSAAGGRLFASYLKDVKSYVGVYDPGGAFVREIRFPSIGTVSGVRGRWDSDEAFYSFSSYHVPPTIYRYSVESGKQEVWAERDVPVESEKFEVNQVWYSSKDGTRVPMFIVHSRDIRLDGSHPTLLTGYGGFNISLTPGFSSEAVAWMKSGGVYAVANLRGGGEFGKEWHRAGMLEKKQNVFDDFIAAAEYLIENRYARPEKLAIMGGSNGGLLVAAVMNQRPELFGAVVCTYPLLDMIRYHKFLVARYWVPEYGSSENAEPFKYLYAYSPYHNVNQGISYPAVLFITGDADTRVDPLHARKMAALMQARTGLERPVLLRYHTKAGHSGGMSVSEQIENTTDTLSFLLWQLR